MEFNKGHMSGRATGDGFSYCEEDSLVRSGHDGLLYKLCGCLPCFKVSKLQAVWMSYLF